MSKQAAGGNARAEKLTQAERSAIAKKGAQARWSVSDAPLLKAKNIGILTIGDISIPCAVLDDQTRVLSESGITEALLGSRSGASKRLKQSQENLGGAPLPVFLATNAIKSYLTEELTSGPLRRISYRAGARIVHGYEARALATVCDLWLKARAEGKLQSQQLDKAMKAEILMRVLAQVAIVALIDEATGYQAERDKDELQKLLKHYLTEEALKWMRAFPAEFFNQIYRLRGWKRPLQLNAHSPFMGHLINEVVYDRLPEGVLDELRKKNPKTEETGYRKYKHHQFLTEDIGQPHLQAHLQKVIVLMQISQSWEEFKQFFGKAFSPNSGIQPPLGLND